MPDVSGHTFLFIGGLHRSGTSILHRLLCEHPDVSGFSRTGFHEDEGQHLQDVFPAAKFFGGPGRFAFNAGASLRDDPQFRSEKARDRLLREWGIHYDLTKPVLVEKSPPNLIRSEYFRTVFPGSRFVFIVRHPIPVALATAKWSQRSILEHLLHWLVAHRRMAADCTAAEDTIVLRYEDFVADPQFFLDQIARRADLPPFAPRETISNHNPQYFDQWLNERQADANLLKLVLPEMQGCLEPWGYSLRPPFVGAASMDLIPWIRPATCGLEK